MKSGYAVWWPRKHGVLFSVNHRPPTGSDEAVPDKNSEKKMQTKKRVFPGFSYEYVWKSGRAGCEREIKNAFKTSAKIYGEDNHFFSDEYGLLQ